MVPLNDTAAAASPQELQLVGSGRVYVYVRACVCVPARARVSVYEIIPLDQQHQLSVHVLLNMGSFFFLSFLSLFKKTILFKISNLK